ncbi:MAG: hypothetical protein Tp1125DCM00d2C21254131_49 [Prokaryotic dsDNA virus sp.]|nr:MAG: hypothetical protein Tp1125DCM00d2C21254131_49 [Prokaryotic dsDNA virus sp.]|tara:strand:+ start:1112 stop:2110 length:999 start_codon:yes stop_codon:yes gene_type:complete
MAINPLMALFAAQGGPQAQQVPEQEPIIVERTVQEEAPLPTSAGSRGPTAPNMSNVDYLEELQYVQDQAPERKGRFGTKGTLRDILGTLGDAFLMQSGNKPMYAQRREQERVADAMVGFSQDPMAAMERLANAGYAEQAGKLQGQFFDQLNDAQTQRLKQSGLELDQNKNLQKSYEDYGALFSNMIGAATPETYERIKPILNRIKEVGGLTDEYMVPDVYDPDYAAVIAQGGMPVSRQITAQQGERRLEQGDKRIGISQQNADTSRMNATRPRAAPRPRGQTTLEYYKEIGAKPESQRTPAEKDFYDKYVRSGGARSTNGRRPVETGKSRFR